MTEVKEEKLSDVAAIRKFFSEGLYGRKVEITELKELAPTDRQELGTLCRAELEKS